MSPQECFNELKPSLNEIMRLVGDSPLTQEQRFVLAVLVAGHWFGVVAAIMGVSLKEGADTVSEAILKSIEHCEPRKLDS